VPISAEDLQNWHSKWPASLIDMASKFAAKSKRHVTGRMEKQENWYDYDDRQKKQEWYRWVL